MRRDIADIRDRVAGTAHDLGLPVEVMHVPTRPPGCADRWASTPTPRAAVGFLTTDDPAAAAAQLVRDWCDAQQAVGHTVTADEHDALERAAGTRTEETDR